MDSPIEFLIKAIIIPTLIWGIVVIILEKKCKGFREFTEGLFWSANPDLKSSLLVRQALVKAMVEALENTKGSGTNPGDVIGGKK